LVQKAWNAYRAANAAWANPSVPRREEWGAWVSLIASSGPAICPPSTGGKCRIRFIEEVIYGLVRRQDAVKPGQELLRKLADLIFGGF
jgi:hypothetical protein